MELLNVKLHYNSISINIYFIPTNQQIFGEHVFCANVSDIFIFTLYKSNKLKCSNLKS